jgi:alkylation response protein AidB-like acyl-CoA dehydrogenase
VVDFTLTTQQHDLVDQARAVAHRCVAPRAAQYDRSGDFPADNFADLVGTGLLGLLIPADRGGLGADMVTYALTVAEFAEACGSTALIFAMHCGATHLLSASDDPSARHALQAVIDRGELIAWGFSEPGTGGNVLTPQLRGTRTDDGGFTLNGTKTFCTGAGHVAYYVINTNSGESEWRRSQSMFLLPADTAGLTVNETWDALGMRANCANTVLLDTQVPAAACIGGHGAGIPLLAHSLPALVIGLAAASLGVARAANAVAAAHVTRRVHANAGVNLAGYQGVRFQIADMATALHTAYLSLLHAAATADTDPLYVFSLGPRVGWAGGVCPVC